MTTPPHEPARTDANPQPGTDTTWVTAGQLRALEQKLTQRLRGVETEQFQVTQRPAGENLDEDYEEVDPEPDVVEELE